MKKGIKTTVASEDSAGVTAERSHRRMSRVQSSQVEGGRQHAPPTVSLPGGPCGFLLPQCWSARPGCSPRAPSLLWRRHTRPVAFPSHNRVPPFSPTSQETPFTLTLKQSYETPPTPLLPPGLSPSFTWITAKSILLASASKDTVLQFLNSIRVVMNSQQRPDRVTPLLTRCNSVF